MISAKKRNGILELYRLFIGFWVLSAHDFFFFHNSTGGFSQGSLAADFFFIISGFFLLRSMQKMKEQPIYSGLKQLITARIKPLFFSLCFISCFAVVCIVLFMRDDILGSAFFIFRYWWYVLYLVIASAAIYLAYRQIKTKKNFIIFLFALAFFTALLYYLIDEYGILIFEITFILRAFGCLAAGMLISYIPRWEYKKFNHSIPISAVLLLALLVLAYNKKNFFICILILVTFSALVYFTLNISFGGKVFDIIGLLSTRIYLYISFISTLYILGLTNHRVLFIIDVAVASLDLILTIYKQKYDLLKAKSAV